ncbi:sugar isomerase domain-containing protein [Streptomyces boninensis]|uniref:sugar isomerase domain-containing protein n=1 Tax=Streptomyces boninensis TaxID=2039455 RepID=UPI003B2178EE
MSLAYPQLAREIVDRIEATQEAPIRAAADVFADAIAAGGLVHLFGAGHSRMGVEEIFPRIGSIVGYHPIVELSLSYYTNVVGTMGLAQALFLERQDGFGELLLSQYAFGPHDAAMVISSTGINNVPVEVALGLKSRGLPVVALTSVAHSSSVDSRHPSGKHLYEVADVVVDNCTPPGDAAVHVEGCDYPVGPTSTIGTVVAAHSINALLAEGLVARGVKPVVLGSPHFSDEESARRNLADYYAAHLERTRGV